MIGKLAAGIFKVLTKRIEERLDCVIILPILTYKVKRRLVQLPDLNDIPIDLLFKITKKLCDDVGTILSLFDVGPEQYEKIEEEIEESIRLVFEERNSKNEPFSRYAQ